MPASYDEVDLPLTKYPVADDFWISLAGFVVEKPELKLYAEIRS